MVKTFLLLLLILLPNSVVFSHNDNDLQKWSVKGKVFRINDYHGYDDSDPERSAVANVISSSSFFNRRGNLSVHFETAGSGAACYYKKTVYVYDRKNRKKEKLLYESERDADFCAPTASLFQDNQTAYPNVKTTLIEKTAYFYDRKGHLIQETAIDGNNTIVQEDKFEFNARGENTRYTITQQKYRIAGASGSFVQTMDFRMIDSDGGKTRETYRYEDGKLIYKIVHYMDRHGRLLKEEQYRLESDVKNNIVKATLSSLSATSYDGSREILDWMIYDNSGNLSQQLYVLSENDEELLRIEYAPRKPFAEQNESGSERFSHYRFLDSDSGELNQRLKYILKFDRRVDGSDWVPSDFEARYYKFDARDNIVQTLFVRKAKEASEKDHRTIYNRDVIYHQ